MKSKTIKIIITIIAAIADIILSSKGNKNKGGKKI
jgi:hypothetical protein